MLNEIVLKRSQRLRQVAYGTRIRLKPVRFALLIQIVKLILSPLLISKQFSLYRQLTCVLRPAAINNLSDAAIEIFILPIIYSRAWMATLHHPLRLTFCRMP